MKTSWKPLGRSLLLIAQWKNGQQSLKGEESLRMKDDLAAPKDATGDENVKVEHSLVMCDRRGDLRNIASKLGISFGAVQSILTDNLSMSKVSARWVPQMFTDDQKRTRLHISSYLLSRYEDDLGNFVE